MTKTDIGGEKMKREDEIENEIQYAYCPERRQLPGGTERKRKKITIGYQGLSMEDM